MQVEAADTCGPRRAGWGLLHPRTHIEATSHNAPTEQLDLNARLAGRDVTRSNGAPLLISGGRVIDPWQNLDALGDVLLQDGRVRQVRLRRPGDAPDHPEGAQIVDATGMIVAPGFVDLHCHLREPGQEHKETVATGTRAAARGGFTTVCAMPNTEPAIDTADRVAFVLQRAREAAAVRVLPIGAITIGRRGEELTDMRALAAAGAVAFSDDGAAVIDADLMRGALRLSGELDAPISQHSEDPSVIGNAVAHEGAVAGRLGLAAAPASAETRIVARDLELAAEAGGRLHVAHASAADTVSLLRDARERGIPFTAEATPHHLTLSDEALLGESDPQFGWPPGAERNTSLRVNPPIRSRQDVAALAQALADGVIDAIATDHAPHAHADKAGAFETAAPGISGIETAFGLLMTALVHTGRLDIPTLIARLTRGPASVIGAAAQAEGIKGLVEGATADVVILDPDRSWTVTSADFASLGKNTPLEGCQLRGMVVGTYAAGRPVYSADGDAAGSTLGTTSQ